MQSSGKICGYRHLPENREVDEILVFPPRVQLQKLVQNFFDRVEIEFVDLLLVDPVELVLLHQLVVLLDQLHLRLRPLLTAGWKFMIWDSNCFSFVYFLWMYTGFTSSVICVSSRYKELIYYFVFFCTRLLFILRLGFGVWGLGFGLF